MLFVDELLIVEGIAHPVVKFKDTGDVIRSLIEECRQSDYQEKKGQATIYKTPHRKLTIEQHGSAKTNPGVNSGSPAPLVAPIR